jgi:hypothetical protein
MFCIVRAKYLKLICQSMIMAARHHRLFFLLTLVASLVGIFLTLDSSITGFVVSDLTSVKHIYAPQVIFFTLAILSAVALFVSGDSLQKRLEEKENEQPSPSLEGTEQTVEEEKHFGKRYSGKRSFFDLFTKKTEVEQVPQKESIHSEGDKSYFSLESNHAGREESWTPERTRVEEKYKLKREESMKSIEYKIRKLRGQLLEAKKDLDSQSQQKRLDGYYFLKSTQDYQTLLDKIKKEYFELKMDFNPGIHDSLLVKKRTTAFGNLKGQFLEAILNNEHPIYADNDHGWFPRNRGYLLKLIQTTDISPHEVLSMPDVKKLYIEKAKTVPITEAMKNFGGEFIHAFPHSTNRKHMGYNNRALSEGEIQNYTLKDFLRIVLENKPMLSAATYKKNETNMLVDGRIGIIFKSGVIYDAGGKDLGSLGLPDGSRFRQCVDPHFSEGYQPIEHRVNTSTKNYETYNEFIIGGDYQIKGLYIGDAFLNHAERNKSRPDSYEPSSWMNENWYVWELLQEAIGRGLPVYKYTKEGGFEEINPKKYLKEHEKNKKAMLKAKEYEERTSRRKPEYRAAA